MAQRFVGWLLRAEWTPHGDVFDVGITTREAIFRLDAAKVPPVEAGPTGENNNGNGSLMRIAPLGLWFAHAPEAERRQTAMDVSRLTHGHPRSQIACAFYVELVAALTRGELWGVALDRHPHPVPWLDR